MKYLLTLTVLITLYCTNEADAKMKCMACKSSSSSSDCQSGKATGTCEGKYCYQYIYIEVIKKFIGYEEKPWWIRGCTSDVEYCDEGSHTDCMICNTKNMCNTKKLRKSITKPGY
ncbi:uncharacterized protein LOC123315847 [Coccinella septempunctata]|uniref:uncharacterized protein LOC123315847 n=1 Tax=Coccinella septempunctata TaxID=41139 RepID=UPI001D061288|nr:uncharacterized protein LOC123315847 [Coccinella septempunctata]